MEAHLLCYTFPMVKNAAVFFVLVSVSSADVPKGWEWTASFPFRDLTVTASSEQSDRWPAWNAIDGNVSEPEGIWQTQRNSPKDARLELTYASPRTVRGVKIYHQENPRYYRSLDYTIACWVEGDWQTVANVADNETAGWRTHTFDPIQTDRLRVHITRSAHGYRMGLNEVELLEEIQDLREEKVLPPVHCGMVRDMGIIEYEVIRPKGTFIDVFTRTASKEGEWTPWSPAYQKIGQPISNPTGQWIQVKAAFRHRADVRARITRLRLGSPGCVERLDLGMVLPKEGESIAPLLHFKQQMEEASALSGEVSCSDGNVVQLTEGRWLDTNHPKAWQFAPIDLKEISGKTKLSLGGAKTKGGLLMMREETDLIVGTEPILKHLQEIGAWMMDNPSAAIFIEGYNERTLLGLYEVTKEERYLKHVRKWVHELLASQKEEGYWGTGYGDVYFADTGSALGLLVNFYKFATPEEREAIDRAFERYVHLLLVKGDTQGRPFVHEDGSLGVGYKADKEGNISGDLNAPYTISTALTGAEIFAALYYMKGEEEYKNIAIKACDWVLKTMAPNGQIPYYIDDWNPGRKDQHYVWERWPYDTSAYAGEGFLAAWTYIDDEAFRRSLGERVKPHVNWLLTTQNADGSWAKNGSGDQLRSHGVVNFLLWYYEKIEADPRIPWSLQRYLGLVLDEERSAYLKIREDSIATSLVGRALLEIAAPGVDCQRWKESAKK